MALHLVDHNLGTPSAGGASARTGGDGTAPAGFDPETGEVFCDLKDLWSDEFKEKAPSPRTGALVNKGISGRKVAGKALKGPPSYVKACIVNDDFPEAKAYMLRTWEMGKPSEAAAHFARCGAWRCPVCQRYRASVDFARIRDAFEPFSAEDVVYMVTTFDRNGTFGGRSWEDTDEAYLDMGRMNRMLLKRINRWLKKNGLDPIGSRWVGVAEAHLSGYPHMNLVVVSKGLADFLRESVKRRIDEGKVGRQLILAEGELLEHIVGAGWGPQSTMEVARSKDAIAGYLMKVAVQLGKDGDDESRGRLTGEIAKMTQVPLNAPLNFRRLRSGRGFLVKKEKGDKTGAMFDQNDIAFGVGKRGKEERDLGLQYGELSRKIARDRLCIEVLSSEEKRLKLENRVEQCLKMRVDIGEKLAAKRRKRDARQKEVAIAKRSCVPRFSAAVERDIVLSEVAEKRKKWAEKHKAKNDAEEAAVGGHSSPGGF